MPTTPPRPPAAILFDLDGTLVDSVSDLATAANLTLVDAGLSPLPESQIAGFVGDGVLLLIARTIAAANGESDPENEDVGRAHLPTFRRHYDAHLLDRTHFLPGAEDLLAALRNQVPMAVVTNKPEAPAKKILAALGVLDDFVTVIGGDSTAERKPNPLPIITAARRCGVDPRACVMVGDGPTDADAGRRAGCYTIGVPSNLGPGRIQERVDWLAEDLYEVRRHLAELMGTD